MYYPKLHGNNQCVDKIKKSKECLDFIQSKTFEALNDTNEVVIDLEVT